MRFLILLVVLFWAIALLVRAIGRGLRNLVNPAPPQSRSVSEAGYDRSLAERLVRDPICGVHITESRAILLRNGTELVHFCSAACRDKFIARESRIAANG
jgi:YHS domain-containing protein